MSGFVRNGSVVLGMLALAACQSANAVDNFSLSAITGPQPLIVTIAKSMQKCWFRTKNPAFRSFRIANEANSYAGKPRLLLVPKNKPEGLPSLVVQAEKHQGTTRLQVYGPLLATRAGQMISTDLKNWTSGKTACANKRT